MSCLCPDVWDVIASFMPPDGKGEGYYRLARVCKSILLPVLLEKGKREVRQRLLSVLGSHSLWRCTHRWINNSWNPPGAWIRAELQRGRRRELLESTPPLQVSDEIKDLRDVIDLWQRDSDTWAVDNDEIAMFCLEQYNKTLHFWFQYNAATKMH